jgi:hypothetical protein
MRFSHKQIAKCMRIKGGLLNWNFDFDNWDSQGTPNDQSMFLQMVCMNSIIIVSFKNLKSIGKLFYMPKIKLFPNLSNCLKIWNKNVYQNMIWGKKI